MAKKQSAGLLLYRKLQHTIEVFLVHPGGPYWKNKDEGVWSIPKGEFDENEQPLQAAIREFSEETGLDISGKFLELNPVQLKSGKIVYALAIEKNIDAEKIISNHFETEWPPHSGKFTTFPEVDKGEWFIIEVARKKINQGQIPILNELKEKLSFLI